MHIGVIVLPNLEYSDKMFLLHWVARAHCGMPFCYYVHKLRATHTCTAYNYHIVIVLLVLLRVLLVLLAFGLKSSIQSRGTDVPRSVTWTHVCISSHLCVIAKLTAASNDRLLVLLTSHAQYFQQIRISKKQLNKLQK